MKQSAVTLFVCALMFGTLPAAAQTAPPAAAPAAQNVIQQVRGAIVGAISERYDLKGSPPA